MDPDGLDLRTQSAIVADALFARYPVVALAP
jgi:hypothetical protein